MYKLNGRFIILGLLMVVHLLAVQAQNRADELGIIIMAGRTPALDITRDYTSAEARQADINSRSATGFAVQLSYGRAISSCWGWEIGLEGGADAYHLGVFASSAFGSLGQAVPYEDEATFTDLAYGAVMMGLRYRLPLTKGSSLSLGVAARFAYYLPVSVGLGSGAVPLTGNPTSILQAELSINPNNSLVLAPVVDLGYRYRIADSRFQLRVATQAVIADKQLLTGGYQLVGDQKTLRGDFEKQSGQLRVDLGVIYELPN